MKIRKLSITVSTALVSVLLHSKVLADSIPTDLSISSLGDTPSDPSDIISSITNTLLTVAGVISVIMIIVGGIMYALSAGDSGKAGKAKDTILYSVIGLAITMLAYAIVNFVIAAF